MSTLKTDVIKDVAETVAINVTDIGSVVSLPQDLANDSDPTKGAGVIGYLPSPDYPVGSIGAALSEQAGRVSALEAEPHTAPPLALRIAFHYNYEDTPEKLERLKALGFNAVWVYRTAPWMGDVVRSLAFLDSLYKRGIFAVFQPDPQVIADGSGNPQYAAEMQWIANISSHPALLGFATYDEPGTQQVLPTDQQAFYDNIKSVTSKSVFCVDGTHTWQEQDAYLWSPGRDVSAVDIYAHKEPSEAGFKKYFIRSMFNLLSYDGAPDLTNKRAGRQSIPVLGLFSGEGVPLPTMNQVDWYVDCWRPFVSDASYAIFAHDIPWAGYDTLDNSDFLRVMCSRIASQWGQRGDFGYSLAKPGSLQVSSHYVASNNIQIAQLFSQPNRLIISANSQASLSVTLRADIPPGATSLITFCKFFNRYDADARNVIVSLSEDGVNFSQAETFVVGAAPNGDDLLSMIPINTSTSAVHVKFEIDPLAAAVASGYVGLGPVGAVAI